MRRIRHKYSATAIMRDWREVRHIKGYASELAKKHRVPISVIYNVIHRCRRKKAEINRNYREKNNNANSPKPKRGRQTKRIIAARYIFQNSVAYAAAAIDAKSLTI